MKIRVVALCVALSACGGGNSPTTPTPTVVSAAGIWTGTVTQTGATGASCPAFFNPASNGVSSQFTVTIAQAGSTLTATDASQSTGQSCNYTGTISNGSVSLAVTSCNPPGYIVNCAGVNRDIYLIARSITGTVTTHTLIGTTGESWNVDITGTTTPVGSGTFTNSFSFTR